MLLYHLGSSLKPGDELIPDFKGTRRLVLPLLKSLEISEECFRAAMLNAFYLREVMRKSRLREWSDCSKWGTEAVFEFVRAREFPGCPSRLGSNFYFDSLDRCGFYFKREYLDSGDDAGDLAIYEIEVDDPACRGYSMDAYDRAYQEMDLAQGEALEKIMGTARAYWAGDCAPGEVLERLSDRRGVVKRLVAKPAASC